MPTFIVDRSGEVVGVTTPEQERIIKRLVEHRLVKRAEICPLPDDSRDVWCYSPLDLLMFIVTVRPDGSHATRAGFRPTDDTYVGHPEDRPDEAEPLAELRNFLLDQADWSTVR